MPMVYNPKTGKKKSLNITRSRSAKKAALKRHKPISMMTRKKISKSLRKANKTGKTRFGIRVRRH